LGLVGLDGVLLLFFELFVIFWLVAELEVVKRDVFNLNPYKVSILYFLGHCKPDSAFKEPTD
jgi:hypothetical protein